MHVPRLILLLQFAFAIATKLLSGHHLLHIHLVSDEGMTAVET